MTAYNEVEYHLCKWPTTTAISTLARGVKAHSSAAKVADCLTPARAGRPELHSEIASPTSGLIAGQSAWAAAEPGDGAKAWGFA
jgi:hypothetical protein